MKKSIKKEDPVSITDKQPNKDQTERTKHIILSKKFYRAKVGVFYNLFY